MCNRPFDSIEEMDETLISNWNSRVKGNDTVYILGDLFYRSENAEDILSRLKAKRSLLPEITTARGSQSLMRINILSALISSLRFLTVSVL